MTYVLISSFLDFKEVSRGRWSEGGRQRKVVRGRSSERGEVRKEGGRRRKEGEPRTKSKTV